MQTDTEDRKAKRARDGERGRAQTDEYKIWSNMKYRCGNRNAPNYANYGGRGITVCDRWSKFLSFLADMGPRPSKKHSLNRINNDGPYEPTNCEWATAKQQGRNRRTNVLISDGETSATLVEWAEQLGTSKTCIQTRIKRGVAPADAVKHPSRWCANRLLTLNGETFPVAEWSRRTGISAYAIWKRLHIGWSVEKALTTPPRRWPSQKTRVERGEGAAA